MPAHTVLEMATLNAARALGLDSQIGSLTKGKRADITAVNLAALICLHVMTRCRISSMPPAVNTSAMSG